MRRNNLREAAFKGEFEVASCFQSQQDIVDMTEPFSMEFRESYKKGFTLYQYGMWQQAKAAFESAVELLDEGTPDPLSANLLKFMAEFDFQAPPDWKGYKPFDE